MLRMPRPLCCGTKGDYQDLQLHDQYMSVLRNQGQMSRYEAGGYRNCQDSHLPKYRAWGSGLSRKAPFPEGGSYQNPGSDWFRVAIILGLRRRCHYIPGFLRGCTLCALTIAAHPKWTNLFSSGGFKRRCCTFSLTLRSLTVRRMEKPESMRPPMGLLPPDLTGLFSEAVK